MREMFPDYEFVSLKSQSPIEDIFWVAIRYRINGLKQQIKIKTRKKTYIVDFLIPKINLIIECYGKQYHKGLHKKIKDFIRKKRCEKCGYKMIIFWGTQIFNNVNKCVRKTTQLSFTTLKFDIFIFNL